MSVTFVSLVPNSLIKSLPLLMLGNRTPEIYERQLVTRERDDIIPIYH